MIRQAIRGNGYASLAPLLLLLIPLSYLLTLARGLVLGDPTEYTLVAHLLGIAHPPGYAFFTLLGKLFQSAVPLGEIPWRMHLLSAVMGAAAAFFVYGTVRTIGQRYGAPALPREAAALLAAFCAAWAVNFWQHAIHANPHIVTVAFLAANVYFLTKWWAEGDQTKWLYLFAFSAGLGVVHHPLTVFSFPAYALFILATRPALLREWRALAKMLAFALLGLSVWLYFPIRSPMQPAFGPHDMHTLDGFLNHILARGLTERLTFYGLVYQPLRALVFWSLLRLQYSLPIIGLALFGLLWLSHLVKRLSPPAGITSPARAWTPALLLGVAFLTNYLFVINLTEQDVMAYLLGPLLIVGLLAGIGLLALLTLLQERLAVGPRSLLLLASAFFLLGPALQAAGNFSLVSLRDYDEGDVWIESVFQWFEGRREGAVLLNDWERMTPLWYAQFVEERWPDPADVRPELVATARPWLTLVYDYLAGAPVYLNGYRPEIVNAGFRLRPRGPFYQVVEPGLTSLPPELTHLPQPMPAGDLEIVAYQLPQTEVRAGDYVPLTLAMRAPEGTGDFYVPALYVGEINYTFTTDSHLVTPAWQPGEVIVERFDFALPHDLAAGVYPLRLNLKNLSQDEEIPLQASLGELNVAARSHPPRADHLLANYRQRIGLAGASARQGWQRRAAPWENPMTARPGDVVYIRLQWQSLAPAEESYTVFVHLIDLANRPIVDDLDYTPLGGAAPTHLWIPKWLPGQRYTDPYRLVVPQDIAAGHYLIEVGLYEMTGGRRLHMHNERGDIIGDRYILGSLIVE